LILGDQAASIITEHIQKGYWKIGVTLRRNKKDLSFSGKALLNHYAFLTVRIIWQEDL